MKKKKFFFFFFFDRSLATFSQAPIGIFHLPYWPWRCWAFPPERRRDFSPGSLRPSTPLNPQNGWRWTMSLTSLASGNVAPFRVFHTVCGKSCHPSLSEAVGKRRLKNLNYLFNFLFRFRIRAFQKLLGKEGWKTWNILFNFFFRFRIRGLSEAGGKRWLKNLKYFFNFFFSLSHASLSEAGGKRRLKNLKYFIQIFFRFRIRAFQKLLGRRRLKNLKYFFKSFFRFGVRAFQKLVGKEGWKTWNISIKKNSICRQSLCGTHCCQSLWEAGGNRR